MTSDCATGERCGWHSCISGCHQALPRAVLCSHQSSYHLLFSHRTAFHSRQPSLGASDSKKSLILKGKGTKTGDFRE